MCSALAMFIDLKANQYIAIKSPYCLYIIIHFLRYYLLQI